MVPEGWILSTFEKHIDLLSGCAFKSAGYTENEEDVRLLRGDNIVPNSLRWRNAKRWPVSELHKYERYKLQEHDFVIAMDRTWVSSGVKVSEISISDLPCLLVQRVSRIRALDTLDQSLLKQYFSGHRFEQYVKSVQTETAVPHISAQQIKEFSFLLPPLSEQRKIAKILSTWDKAIATTEKLIETNKQQKKALMQQLLTGKKRFSGFESAWEDKYLNEIAKIIISPVDKKTVDGEIPVELCNYTDVYYNSRITNALTFMKATAKQSEIDKFTLQIGDVIITKDSETPGDIAVPALVSEPLNGVVCGYHLAIVRPNKERVDSAFLNYLFSMPKTRYYFFTLATGATRFGLSVGGINKAHFSLPSLEEQRKIASVLSSADSGIENLVTKLAYLKQEKKALMQQLLTGKRRVQLLKSEE